MEPLSYPNTRVSTNRFAGSLLVCPISVDSVGFHDGFEHVEQLLAFDRFGEIGIHTGVEAPLPIHRECVSRDRDDRCIGAPSPLGLTNRLGGCQAVHVWHLHIHENDIKTIFGCLPDRNCLLSVIGDRHAMSTTLQQSLCQFLIGQSVFGQQNAQLRYCARQRRIRFITGKSRLQFSAIA